MKWTKDKEERLKELALTKSVPDIALELKLDEWQVRNKLSRLKIKPVGTTKDVTIETVRADISKRNQKSKETQLSKQVKLLSEELVKVEKERDAFLEVGNLVSYEIKSDGKESKRSEATTLSLFSDLHGDERVKKSQVNGLNEYNKEIAKKSTEDFFCVVAKLIKVHQREYEIKNHILALLGDFISGSIHDDLKESQDIQPTEAIWMVGGWILSGIKYLRKECPDVNLIIPCSMGNHSRITEKQRVQTEYGNSLELLLYNRLAEYFENDKMVTFLIGDAYFTIVNVYGKKLGFHHGHAVNYGGGIGGLTIPMNKAIAKWDTSVKCDLYFSAHAHTFFVGQRFVVNGSVIGYSPYAVKIKGEFERPTQTFCLINKDRDLEVIRKIILR